jgi:hypothetical protein
MTRRTFLVCCLTEVFLVGCGKSPNAPRSPMSRAELEKDMAERLKLTNVSLKEQSEGQFLGTGTNAEGQVVEIEVQQESRRLSWKGKWSGTDSKGGKASGSTSGSFNW